MTGITARGARLVHLLLPLAVAACSDTMTPPAAIELPPAPAREVALFTCQASVAERTVDCEPSSPETPEGVALDQRIMGGQSRYVTLSSSFVTYNGTEFRFNVTVQNLLTLAMATENGVSRSAQGVRVFFHELPTVTAGSGTMSVVNATGTALFTAADQPYFQYGGILEGNLQIHLGPDGILSSREVSDPINWRLSMPSTVEAFRFSVLVATETPAGALESTAPRVTSVSPAVLVPGSTATIGGIGFDPIPDNNIFLIGGQQAFVTGGSTNELQVTVPCAPSGPVTVAARTGGVTGPAFMHTISVQQRTVPVGAMLIFSDPADLRCNELTPTGGDARYIVSVFSAATTANSTQPFDFSGDVAGLGTPAPLTDPAPQRLVPGQPTLTQVLEQAQHRRQDEQHGRLLDQNVRFLETHGAALRARSPGRLRGTSGARDVSPNRTFRIPNVQSNSFCRDFYVVSATRVYLDGKVAIYEDDALESGLKAENNPTMALNYQRMGDQFNNDMEPIISEYFGDVLRRDSITDDNGVLLILVSPRLNQSFTGTAGFVVGCDLFVNDDSTTPAVGGPYTGAAESVNASSNHGEIFYMYAPTVNGSGYDSGLTPDQWFRTARSTLVHESKHVASYVARVANETANYEEVWLEESTARHVEELWGRLAVDGLDWRANNGQRGRTARHLL